MNHKLIFPILILITVAMMVGCTRSNAFQRNIEHVEQTVPTPQTTATKQATSSDDIYDGIPVVKTDDEWKQQLSPQAFYVMRQEGTERPFTGEYDKNKMDGDYHCAACHLKLFSSKTKFDSGTGWPSFYEPFNKRNVVEKPDRLLGYERIEVECARCGSHLGHVFDDGPKPTGLRYCMNSISLNFGKSRKN